MFSLSTVAAALTVLVAGTAWLFIMRHRWLKTAITAALADQLRREQAGTRYDADIREAAVEARLFRYLGRRRFLYGNLREEARRSLR